jgi:hypothetical protein
MHLSILIAALHATLASGTPFRQPDEYASDILARSNVPSAVRRMIATVPAKSRAQATIIEDEYLVCGACIDNAAFCQNCDDSDCSPGEVYIC